jgi:hypothetical protein
MEHGAWSMEHGTWSMEHGAWNMEHGTWSMEHGAWSMEHGLNNFNNSRPKATCTEPCRSERSMFYQRSGQCSKLITDL